MRFIFSSKILLSCVLLLAILTLFQNYRKLNNIGIQRVSDEKFEEGKLGMKYILLWTSPRNVPFVYMGEGRDGFINRNCSYTNCIVTSNKTLLGDYTNFDVIAFAGPEVVTMYRPSLPKHRLSNQKYVFASIESSNNYPICSNRFEGYFNWTWTYKLDSEVRWGYIVTRDNKNNIIGPNKDINWLAWESMDPVNDRFKKQLKSKTKAAAWFVSNCISQSHREKFATKLKRELWKYNHVVDIYGSCSSLECPRTKEEDCEAIVARDYYFYLSFENAFSEDYVTEKLLIALKNNAVPIVYGGANYSRFLPNKSYLNARELGAENLASKMNELINNPESYADYFRWKNHYSYHRTSDSIETNEYCKVCALLNDEKMIKTKSIYEEFRKWWDPSGYC